MTVTAESTTSDNLEKLLSVLRQHGGEMDLNEFITSDEVETSMSRRELHDALDRAAQLGRIDLKDLASVIYETEG